LANIYTDHFGGNGFTFTYFVLFHHSEPLNLADRLSQRTERQTEILGFLLDQAERLAYAPVNPTKGQGITIANPDAPFAYGLLLMAAQNITVSPNVQGFFDARSIPFARLRAWLEKHEALIPQLATRTGIAEEQWNWFIGAMPPDFVPMYGSKVVVPRKPKAPPPPIPVPETLADIGEYLKTASFRQIRSYVEQNYATMQKIREALPTKPRKGDFDIALALFAQAYQMDSSPHLMTEQLRDDFGEDFHWLGWLLGLATECARTNREFALLLAFVYEIPNSNGLFQFRPGQAWDGLGERTARRAWFKRVFQLWDSHAKKTDSSWEAVFNLLTEALSNPGGSALHTEKLTGDFRALVEETGKKTVGPVYETILRQLPNVDEFGEVTCVRALAP
ncbi:hypothetical protein K2X33_07425, partial [bacterium]|nr:hypothetical protein [bacterium]